MACRKLFEIWRELRISIPQVHLGLADCPKTVPNDLKKDETRFVELLL
jgi:hypothetical protein